MSVPNVTVGNPIQTGTTSPGASPCDYGYAELVQSVTITQPGADATLDTIITLPANAQVTTIIVDRLTAFDSATSATLSVGKASTGQDFVSNIDLKAAAGRTTPTFTAAQLLLMSNVTTNTSLYATVVTVGATTAGKVVVTVHYVQK